MLISLYSFVTGFLLDLILGDPHFIWHPVRGIGFLVTHLESCIRKIFLKNPIGEIFGGVLLVLTVSLISVGIPLLILFIANMISPWVRYILESIMCFQIIAVKSLKDESLKVKKELIYGSIESSRKSVSMIVGRDTENLDEKGIVKATVETVAENTSDGVVAPLIFTALGGAVGGFLYKAINTMDSMIGYKNEKYIYFGKFAAKVDDILNFIPSRVSAFLLIAASFILKYDYKNAYKIYKRDRFNHASPNSAQTESAVAGALGLQLAGDAYYFKKLYKKKYIGDSLKEPDPYDIVSVNKLMYCTSVVAVMILSIIKMVIIIL